MKDKTKLIMCAMVCFTMIICGIIFWPTLYRYDKIKDAYSSDIVKINRLTGYTETFSGNAWSPSVTVSEPPKSQPLPIVEKEKIKGLGSINNTMESFDCVIYNGSSWTITVVTFLIAAIDDTKGHFAELDKIMSEEKAKDGRPIRWRRIYHGYSTIAPLSKGKITISILDAKGINSCEWQVKEILGYKW